MMTTNKAILINKMLPQVPLDVLVTRPVRVVLHGQDEVTSCKQGEVVSLSGEHLQAVLSSGHVIPYTKPEEEIPEIVEKPKKGKK